MNELFIVIRHMTADARMIYFNTGFPQWKISQLKTKLFMAVNSQNKTVCEWWLRLYRGEYSKRDLSILRLAIDKDFDVVEQLEQ